MSPLRAISNRFQKPNHKTPVNHSPNTLPSKIIALSGAIFLAFIPGDLLAQADIPADYAAIIGTTGGTASTGYGSPGSIPPHGRAAFPILIDANKLPMLSAGRYGNGVSSTAGRAIAAAHTVFIDTSATASTTRTLFINSVQWAGKKSPRSSITVGSTDSTVRTFLQGQGFAVKALTTGMTTSTNNLSGVDVIVVNPHNQDFTASALTQITTFAQNGGGIVFASTPWALDSTRFDSWQNILEPYGLTISRSSVSGSSFTVSSTSYPVISSAIPALDALVADASGGTTMSLADKQDAAKTVDRVLAERPGHPDLIASLETLEDSYGIISVTSTANLNPSNKPVEALLARFQSTKFDAMPATDLFVHPSASDWPGLPSATTPTVSRTFNVNGNVPSDSFMNWGDRGRRIETRLYAAPGATLTVTIPSHLINAGLKLEIGCHVDVNFHLSNWRRFPKVTRSVPLNQTVVQTGNVFGGLVWINIPTGASLGSFDVSIAGALEAPSFQLGVDTDEDWNDRLKNLPGAWGVIMTENVAEYGNTPLFTIYVSRKHLQNVSSAEAVAQHWKQVMEKADHYMGYAEHRRRGEAALTDIDIVAGYGHAGWPVMMAYGDSDILVNGAVQNGDWGFYHEIGHTYQDSFDGAYVFATHGEVCVNLVPALVYTHVHNRTAWDGDVHSTFNAAGRLTDRTAFAALAANQRTWEAACSGGRPMAYDFYFNLAEAFDWNTYRTALGRLIAWHRGGADPALDLTGLRTDFNQQAKRDRAYIIFCDATGRNLDTYFQRYGLGVAGLGYDISATAKNHIATKAYPVWIDNTAVQSITNPGVISAVDSLPVGTELATLAANDPQEPGTIWEWDILSGGNGRITIDRRTGKLRVGPLGLDGVASPTHNLTVRARETTAPRYDTQRSITVNVSPITKAPRAASFNILHATSATPVNTVLGTVLTTDTGRTLASVEILSGNPGGNAFKIDLQGRLLVQTPASIPAASVVILTVRGTDDIGATGTAAVRVICNNNRGLREQRWSGSTAYQNQNWSGATNYSGQISTSTTAQNVADNYSRRITGWVVAPMTGSYTFWVASDDDSRLFVGTNSSAFSRVQRAQVSGWTAFQNFDTNTSQQTVPLYLVAGQAYWLEAHHLEGGGGDHISIAWSKPDGSTREIIPTQHLIPNITGITGTASFPAAPVFSSLSLNRPDVTRGSAYSATLAGTANHPTGESIAYSRISGPSWLQVSANGNLSGTPGIANAGTNQWIIRATSTGGLWAEATLTISVIVTDPYEQWLADSFGSNADNPAITGDLIDPDSDGIPNLMEFALNLAPNTPGTIYPALTAERREIDNNDWLTLVIQRNPDAAGLIFTVQSTSDISNPASWTTSNTQILESTPERLVVRDTLGGPRRFLRLRVSRPAN